MVFVKGKSGNPGGRPIAVKEVQTLARSYCVESVQGLIELARNVRTDARARIAAYKEILDRGIGKASQVVRIEGDNGSSSITFELVKGATRKSKESSDSKQDAQETDDS